MEQSLRTIVIPFPGGAAILPQSSVIEILPYSTTAKIDSAPPWVVGTLLWRTRDLPLVRLEYLARGTESPVDTHARVLVVHALGQDPRLPQFGLLGSDVPHPLNLERPMLTADSAAGPLKPGVLSWVRLNQQAAFIPDLASIEASLVPLLRQEA